MKRACFGLLIQFLAATFLLSQSNPVSTVNTTRMAAPITTSKTDANTQVKSLDRYGKLPLSFEVNNGQTDARVRFLSRTGSYALFLTQDEAVLMLSGKKTKPTDPAGTLRSREAQFAADRSRGGMVRMKLRNANPATRITGLEPLPGISNYFIGNDPAKWRSGIPTYAKVKYEEIYSGIDLVYYGNQRQLEYDFIVAPGADLRRIAFEVNGAKQVRRDAQGDLILTMEARQDEIRFHKPMAYQEKDGARREVVSQYVVTDTNRVGFAVSNYDATKPLYIDPLIYSTYLGGSQEDHGDGIVVDSAGNAYVTGGTGSTDFPTSNPLQPTLHGYPDAFVTKLNPSGSALVYSTYLGGSQHDSASGIAVDSVGNAYVTGGTTSTDFPVTPNVLQGVCHGGSNGATCVDAFAVKLDPSGSALVYSTFLGGNGNEVATDIAVDNSGNAYLTGITTSTDFPTMNPLQLTNAGGSDGFIAKFNPTGSAMVYSTYLGGSGDETVHRIALDSAGGAYVTGVTNSTNFPTANPLQSANGGGNDAFLTKINPAGSGMVYSTYLGGSGDDGATGIALDTAGNAFVAGYTSSTNFPTANPLQSTIHGVTNAFLTKLNPSGSAMVYSTYLGEWWDRASAIAVDNAGNAYITGETGSKNFPITVTTFWPWCRGGKHGYCDDAFVTKFNSSGSALLFSSYLGGSQPDWGSAITLDSEGSVYVTGGTFSRNFSTTPGSFQPICPNYYNCYRTGNGFVSKFSITTAGTKTLLSSTPNPSAYGQPVVVTAEVTTGDGGPPDGETVTFLIGKEVLATVPLSGTKASFTTSTLETGRANVIKAIYDGDSEFLGSSARRIRQLVEKATTTITLASSQNPSNLGQPVTFTVTVAPQFSGTPTRTVTFYSDDVALKTAVLRGGTTKFTTKNLTSGTHTITATYNGSKNFTGSSASLTQTVN